MSRRIQTALLILYYLGFTLFYLGWWFHRSAQPVVGLYSWKYLIFLLVLGLGYLPPIFLMRLKQGDRWKAGCLVTASTLLVATGVYLLGALHYYNTREHAFDPFLQMPPPDPPGCADQKRDDSYRILVLGGSTSMCRHLPEAERYPSVLERLLREKIGTDSIEVINAGMEWYTTKHSLINYVTKASDCDADMVLVMHAVNDLYRSFSPTSFAVGEYQPSWSHYYGPAINGARPPSFARHLYDTNIRSATYDFSRTWFSVLGWGEGIVKYGQTRYDSFVYREVDYPPERYVSIEMFGQNLRKLTQRIHEDGAVPVIVTQPFLWRTGLNEQEREVQFFAKSFFYTRRGWLRKEHPSTASLERAMRVCNNKSREIAAGEDVLLIEGEPALPRDLLHFVDDVHYTAQGAGKLAEAVANSLLAADFAGLVEREAEE